MPTAEELATIRAELGRAKVAIQDAEKEIADMERAGLSSEAKAERAKLAIEKDKFAKLASVYGPI
jgi:hypothetical protein